MAGWQLYISEISICLIRGMSTIPSFLAKWQLSDLQDHMEERCPQKENFVIFCYCCIQKDFQAKQPKAREIIKLLHTEMQEISRHAMRGLCIQWEPTYALQSTIAKAFCHYSIKKSFSYILLPKIIMCHIIDNILELMSLATLPRVTQLVIER